LRIVPARHLRASADTIGYLKAVNQWAGWLGWIQPGTAAATATAGIDRSVVAGPAALARLGAADAAFRRVKGGGYSNCNAPPDHAAVRHRVANPGNCSIKMIQCIIK